MKKKASIVSIAGTNDREQHLFAVIDENGRVKFQVWAHTVVMEKKYKLV